MNSSWRPFGMGRVIVFRASAAQADVVFKLIILKLIDFVSRVVLSRCRVNVTSATHTSVCSIRHVSLLLPACGNTAASGVWELLGDEVASLVFFLGTLVWL